MVHEARGEKRAPYCASHLPHLSLCRLSYDSRLSGSLTPGPSHGELFSGLGRNAKEK